MNRTLPHALVARLVFPLMGCVLGGSFVLGGLQAIVSLLDHVNDAQLRSLCEYPPRKPFRRMPMQVAVGRPSIYVAGWYRKYERGLTQTPWQYSAPGETSVSEIISEFLTPHFKPIKATFTSGGREVQTPRSIRKWLSLSCKALLVSAGHRRSDAGERTPLRLDHGEPADPDVVRDGGNDQGSPGAPKHASGLSSEPP